MTYLITNKGLETLEKTGIKKILDSCFKKSFENLDDYLLFGYPHDDKIKYFARKYKVPLSDLKEKINADEKDYFSKEDSFVMHSNIIYLVLKDKLPEINQELKEAVSAYYIYNNHFLKRIGERGAYLWRDNQFLNFICGDMHGDMKILQHDIASDKLVKRERDFAMIDGYYTEWIPTLAHLITFCCQIKKPVPFKNDWNQVFYNGEFQETKPGEVAADYIERLEGIKENKEHYSLQVLPFVNNPKKHINIEKNILHVYPVKSDGGALFMPFIDKESIAWLNPAKKGIEFIRVMWGNPGVRFEYEQIHHAIKGIANCIIHGGSRCMPRDSGLVFRHFPYEKLENLPL